MDKTYQIVWAGVAENDLKDIIKFIAIDSPANALKILNNIKQSTSSLYISPERGRVVPELHEQGIHTYRELILRPWRIIYRISTANVYVLAVIDSRRNVEDVLLKRLANFK